MPTSPCTCHLLRRLARRVTQEYDRAVAPAGLTITQFSLLQHLRHQPGVSASALALRVGMERTTLLRNLRPLIRDGLARYRSTGAGRSADLELTARGLERIRRARPLWAGAQASLEQRLGKDAAALHALLGTAIATLETGAGA